MLYTITQRFTATDLLKMLPELRFPALSMVILLGIATAVAGIFAVKRSVVDSLFPCFLILIRSSWAYQSIKPSLAMLVFPMFLSIICAIRPFSGPWELTLFSEMGEEAEFDLKTSLKKIFSPPLMGFMLGLIIVILHIKLPTFLASDLQYLGSLTTPLSMIFIGLSVSNAGVKQLVLKKGPVINFVGTTL